MWPGRRRCPSGSAPSCAKRDGRPSGEPLLSPDPTPALRIAPPDFLAEPGLKRVLSVLPEARVVGGAVRDALLARRVGDIDLATPSPPEAVTAALERAGLRALPTGLPHGTVTALAEERSFEITTLRSDVATDGRHAEVAFTRSWEADAARRDFTLNALSLTREGWVFDYFGGIADLIGGRVRFVGPPVAQARGGPAPDAPLLPLLRGLCARGAGGGDARGPRGHGGASRPSLRRARLERIEAAACRPGAAAGARADAAAWRACGGLARGGRAGRARPAGRTRGAGGPAAAIGRAGTGRVGEARGAAQALGRRGRAAGGAAAGDGAGGGCGYRVPATAARRRAGRALDRAEPARRDRRRRRRTAQSAARHPPPAGLPAQRRAMRWRSGWSPGRRSARRSPRCAPGGWREGASRTRRPAAPSFQDGTTADKGRAC